MQLAAGGGPYSLGDWQFGACGETALSRAWLIMPVTLGEAEAGGLLQV